MRSFRAGAVVHVVCFCAGLSRRLRGAIVNIPRCAQACRAAAELDAAADPVDLPAQKRSKFQPCDCIAFVQATRRLKRLSSCNEAVSDILKASFPGIWMYLAAEGKAYPSRQYLVKCRLLFDMTMMLMMRHVFERLHIEHTDGRAVSLYMFADGSPSSGYEALPVIEQCLWPTGESAERKLPIAYMGYGHMGLHDKCFAILWVLLLECGPDLQRMRFRLSRIRGWCTDWGVESQICDVEDLLPAFLTAVGFRDAVPPPGKFLFPRAMWVPGWHHCADGIAKHVLGSLRWWPGWLAGLRGVVKIFRIQPYREVIAAGAQKHGLDSAFLKKCPPNFANWRWGTLQNVLSWLIPNMGIMDEAWDVTKFAKAKNGATIKVAHAALTDALFWCRLRIVADLISDLSAFRTWASGCGCHEAQRLKGEKVVCSMQGRRLPEALCRLDKFVSACSLCAARPEPGHMCARVSLDLEGDLAKDRAWGFRALAGLAAEKYGYLRRQPWSLARARSRAVLEQLRDEYDRMDPSERHRVSDELFSGDLREAVDMYAAGGACMPELDSFLKSIEFLPITEEVIEAPHAAMNRELLRQRASSRPWMSATNRLQCNLELFLTFDDAQRAIFSQEWNSVKRLLQVVPSRARIPKKISWPNLLADVYRSTLSVPRFTGVAAARRDGGSKLSKLDNKKVEFLAMVLEKSKYYSFDPGGGRDLLVFQVVWQFSKQAKTLAAVPGNALAMDVGVVMHEVWRSPLVVDGTKEVYPVGDVAHIDALKLGPWHAIRRDLHVWDDEESDVHGCVHLLNPRRPEPALKLGLADPHAPVLLLQESLWRDGWVLSTKEMPAKTLTEPHAGALSRRHRFCRPYLQCCKFLGALFGKGLTQLVHTAPATYYSLVLRSEEPGSVPLRRSAKVYKRMLIDAKDPQALLCADRDEDGFVFSGDEGPPLVEEDETDHDAGDSEDSPAVADDGVASPGESADDGVASSAEPAAESGDDVLDVEGSSSSSDSACDDSVHEEDALADGYEFDGVHIRRDDYESRSNPARSHRRLIIACGTHPRCYKRRGIGEAQCARFGLLEPIAFLLAWREAAVLAGPDRHVGHRPTDAAVEAMWHRVNAIDD